MTVSPSTPVVASPPVRRGRTEYVLAEMKTSISSLSLCLCCLLSSCVVRPHRIWTHPGISGTVRDRQSGKPLAGATVGFRDRTERASTDSFGRYRLDPISKFSMIVPIGDPYFGSRVEASAMGYKTKAAEIGHGTGEVFDSSPPVRRVDIKLQAEHVVAPNRLSAPTLKSTSPRS